MRRERPLKHHIMILQTETHLLSILDCTYWSSGFDVLTSMRLEVDEQVARETLREGMNRLRAWGVAATGHYSAGNAIEPGLMRCAI
ncbi:hypothetical protein P3T23_008228 [Paraburkholderia sp. GAS448]